MADFSYLSDINKSAVEELISQAQDLCVLEQVSGAINCSSFTDSSVPPAILHSSFHKLKSFQLIKPKPLGTTPPTQTPTAATLIRLIHRLVMVMRKMLQFSHITNMTHMRKWVSSRDPYFHKKKPNKN
jgi:hypothetical protein